MPSSRCTVQGCSNISNHSAGISLHRSPASGAVRDQWLRFVRKHRANFAPRGIFVVCSKHFTENCFERGLHVDGSKRTIHSHAIPTVWKKRPEKLSFLTLPSFQCIDQLPYNICTLQVLQQTLVSSWSICT